MIKMNLWKLLAAGAVALMLSHTASAQDFATGLRAYQAGNYTKAVQDWRPLADQGDAKAQNSLGVMYAGGTDVPEDYAATVRWYRKAADQGNARAQFNLGWMYQYGRMGVPEDYAAAVRWFRKAADQGYAAAQNNLGMMYQNGTGVPQNWITAHMWANIAAANGYETAGKLRDAIAARMSAADIARAQAMAGVCLRSQYRNCN